MTAKKASVRLTARMKDEIGRAVCIGCGLSSEMLALYKAMK